MNDPLYKNANVWTRAISEPRKGVKSFCDYPIESAHKTSNEKHELFSRCKYDGFERDCSKIFSPTITDEGQCCSFNAMPESLIFKKAVVSNIFMYSHS